MATTPGKPLPDPEGESRGCRFHTEAQIYALIEQARAEERERCACLCDALAKKADENWRETRDYHFSGRESAAQELAVAIRNPDA